ncbi:phosphopantetheine-binding protein [bacterium]|jgi:acyl carrier protein|nr:phosphopantetheine-binding protein [bacterium]
MSVQFDSGIVKEVILAAKPSFPVDELGDGDDLREAGIDSLDMMTIVLDCSEKAEFEVPDEDINRLATIKGIVDYFNEKTGA